MQCWGILVLRGHAPFGGVFQRTNQNLLPNMECCTLYITISAEAMADTVVAFLLIVVCLFSTFFYAYQENQTIFFGAASAISSLEIIEVSIAGKHFLYQNKSENHAGLKI